MDIVQATELLAGVALLPVYRIPPSRPPARPSRSIDAAEAIFR
jgi:hypothetical protein